MRGDSARPNGSRLLVLGYHNVTPTWCWPMTATGGRSTFGRQMAALAKLTNIVPLDKALDDLAEGRPLPPRAVAITFDDGYRDNLTSAVPVLGRLGIPATMFLVPGFLSHRVHAWWERLAWAVTTTAATTVDVDGARLDLSDRAGRIHARERIEAVLKRCDDVIRHTRLEQLVDALQPPGTFRGDDLFMDWNEARDLVRAGISIGSHTTGHAILAREGERAQFDDLREARRLLEQRLEAPARVLAYPNGQPEDYDDTTIAATRAAGHSYAVTTWGSVTDADTPPFEVRRWMVSPDQPAAKLVLSVLRSLHGYREQAHR